jgi:hypothetical protein
VADLGDRPEQAVLGLDAVPGGAGVVRGAAGGREAELLEDLLGVLVLEVLALAEPLGDVQQDLPVEPGLPGGVTAALILMMRPSPLVEVPSSSSWSDRAARHRRAGRTRRGRSR